MSTTSKKISVREYMQKMNTQDYIYIGVQVIFFGIVIILFLLATQFISTEINKVFTINNNNSVQALNFDQYNLVAKKLGISTSTPEMSIAANSSSTITLSFTTSTLSTTTNLDKHAITINVRNSTTRNGAAAALAKLFETNGFSKPITGAETKSYATTTIIINNSKQDYESLLLDVVHQTYPSAIATTTLTESTLFDATVIIGTK